MDASGDPKGYYRRLGVVRTATGEELRAAFRDQAKLYHPDQGGPEASADRLREVVEAWEVLSDPVRRAAYDAEARMRPRAKRRAGQGFARRQPASDAKAARPAKGIGLLSAAVLLGIVAIGMTALWWTTSLRLTTRDQQLAELSRRLGDALSGRSQERAREQRQQLAGLEGIVTADQSGAAVVFGATIAFPAGSSSLEGTGARRLEQASAAMIEAAHRLPPDRDWFVLVDGNAGAAMLPGGVPIDEWGRAVLRLATVLDRLASRGLPADRVVTRLVAGPSTPGRSISAGDVVSLRLLCCRDAEVTPNAGTPAASQATPAAAPEAVQE